MPDLTASLKRVPKWAWLTSAGVGIGGIAAYTIHNRSTVEDPTAADGSNPTDAVTGYPTSSSPSPVPGIVVPDVNVVGTDDGGSSIELQTTYLDMIQELFNSVLGSPAAIPSPATPTGNTQLPVVTGGGAPSTPRPGVVVAQPPPSQAPKPKPCCMYDGHPLSWWQSKSHAYKSGKGWKWPHEGGAYKHTRAFAGHHACDGGGTAGGSKRNC